jgi:hemoglobin/transferrin/lactoferrin receptor protein
MRGFRGRMALLRGVLIATTAVGTLGGVGYHQIEAWAQEARVVSYDIPAQSLTTALTAFARASGLRLAYPAALTEGRATAGVSGILSSAEALAGLLAGTGLTYAIDGDVVTIADPARAPVAYDGSIMLDTIDVVAWVENAGVGWDGTAETVYITPGSVTHISSEQIQTFRGSSVGDFLSGTPGVINADNRNSGALDINIRGMQGFGRVPVVVDGSQQQNTIYRGYAGVANRTYIDPDLISSVSIQRGPAGGVHGAGAVGGLAVMNTLTADDILREGQTFGVRVVGGFVGNTSPVPAPWTLGGVQPGGYMGAGWYATNPLYTAIYPLLSSDWQSWGSEVMDRPGLLEPTGGHGSIAVAASGDNYEFVAAYARRIQGNYHAGTVGDGPVVQLWENVPPGGVYQIKFPEVNRYRLGEEVLNTSQDNTSWLGKFTVRGSDGHSLELSYRRYESDFGEIMPSVLVDAGPTQAPLSEVRSDALAARYQWNPEDNDLVNLRANIWTTRTHTSITTPYNLFGMFVYESEFMSLENKTGFDISNTSVLDAGIGQVTLQYGGSYLYETIQPSVEEFTYPQYALRSRDGWRQEASAFVAAEWSPLDWLKLDGGLRYTAAHAYDNSLSTVPSGPLSGTQLHNEESGAGFAPNAGVTVEPLAGWQLYGRYAEALRIASLYESTRSAGLGASWSYDPAPLLDLRPERAKVWEFGTNFSFDDLVVSGDRLGIKLAWFDSRVDDFMTRMYLPLPPAGIPTTTMHNIHHASFRGIELSANYDAGGFFAEVGGTYYTDIEFCITEGRCYSGGVPSGYVNQNVPPRFSATGTLGVRLLEESLTLGARITHMGERAADYRDVGNGIRNVVNWEPYTLVDVFASYDVTEDVTLDLAIDNVGDLYYMDSLTLGYNPSPGRTFRASLTAKF